MKKMIMATLTAAVFASALTAQQPATRKTPASKSITASEMEGSGMFVLSRELCRYSFQYDESTHSCSINITFETDGSPVTCTVITPVDKTGHQSMKCSYVPKLPAPPETK